MNCTTCNETFIIYLNYRQQINVSYDFIHEYARFLITFDSQKLNINYAGDFTTWLDDLSNLETKILLTHHIFLVQGSYNGTDNVRMQDLIVT